MKKLLIILLLTTPLFAQIPEMPKEEPRVVVMDYDKIGGSWALLCVDGDTKVLVIISTVNVYPLIISGKCECSKEAI